jgi:hypothetical protein
MRRKSLVWSLLLFACVLAIRADDGISPDANAYLNGAVKIMEEHFVHRDKIDWQRLREETLSHAAGAQTAVDTYPAIRFALAKLGDHHSYLQLTPELSRLENSRKQKLVNPSLMPNPPVRKRAFPFPSPFQARRVPEGAIWDGPSCPTAQVVVPLFSSAERSEIDAFATKLQSVIRELAERQPRGWIVDLRGNGGGNLWAMMAGVGPILGEGDSGASLQADGTKGQWYYSEGKAGWRNDTKDPYYARITGEPVRVAGTPPVAVLLDRATGSSGEGIAIAFRGRPDTRFFGESTYGAATSTSPYTLSDGAQLFLVTGVMVDRRGLEYPDGIIPDEEIVSEVTISTADPVIHAAAEWISGLKVCRSGVK